MIIIREQNLSFIESPGGNAGAGLATPALGAREVSLVRQRQQPGGFNPPHSHDREEVMLVLAGQIAVSIGDEAHSLSGGDTLIIPARTQHQIKNESQEVAEWLLIAPAGVRFFHANGDEARPAWAG